MTANATMRLANGHEFMTRMDVTGGEANGLLVLIVTSSISALAIVSLFTAIALSAWNTRKSTNEYLFVRSQAAVYLVCMLLCDLTQAVGSIMNGKWYASKEVIFEPFCTAQGALKQIADVGIAMWALVIAMHTFWVLFMEWRVHRYVMWGMLIFNWSAIATVVIAGPATMNMPHNGPFYGISGYWCWISDQYPAARIALDYAFMFFSAVLSFILYALIFLKLRGNIRVTGSRVKVRKHHDLDSLRGYSADDTTVNAAKGMMLYPVSYTIIILPITICRFLSWSGVAIPFAATIFSDVVYLLSGFINVCLFVFMRRVLPRHSIITKRFGKNKDEERRSSTFYDVPTLTGGDSEPSYISEKLSETETQHDDKDKMFVLVDSPDADSFPHHRGTKEPLVPPTPSFAQRTPASAGVGSPGTAFSQSSPGTFARISLDNAYSPASRAQFPASAGGMVYPQSPIAPLASARSPVPPRSPLPALKSPQPVQPKSLQPLQEQARSPDGQGRSPVDGFRIITEE